MKRIIAFSFLFLSLSNFAFADYNVWSNSAIRTLAPNNADTIMTAFNGDDIVIEYTATSSVVTQFDRISVALCRYTGTTGGEIYLEVRSFASTTGEIVASSTLAVNNGNVFYPCDPSTNTNTNLSTFVLNNNIQFVRGTTLWFRFRPVGTAGDIYFSSNSNNQTNWNTLYLWRNNAKYYDNSDYWSVISFGDALGTRPSTSWDVWYSAFSTPVVCGALNLGCYITTSFSFLFLLPNGWDSVSSAYADVASTTRNTFPFNLGLLLLDGVTEVFEDSLSTHDDFVIAVPIPISSTATTSLVILDTSTASSTSSLAFIRNNVRPWLVAICWLAFLFYMFNLFQHILQIRGSSEGGYDVGGTHASRAPRPPKNYYNMRRK